MRRNLPLTSSSPPALGWLALWAVASLLLALHGCGAQAERPEERAVEESLLESADLASAAPFSDLEEQLRRVYREDGIGPVWVTGRRISEAGVTAVERFCSAEADGLDLSRYRVEELLTLWRQALESPPEDDSVAARRMAALELAVSERVARYAADLATGALPPRSRGAEVHLPARQVRPSAVLRAVAAAPEQADEILDAFRPPHPAYLGLRQALERYRRVADDGGWPTVPHAPRGSYEEGDAGPGVVALRARLAAEDESVRVQGDRFDGELGEAVRRFQERHGLEQTGAVGGPTLEALNVPAAERLDQIRLNMERWRFLPEELGREHILVNIPAFHLEVRRGGETVLEMPVIVGEEYEGRATPVFADTLSWVEFSPYWYVPERIAREEIVPRIRDDLDLIADERWELLRIPDEDEEGETGGVEVLDPKDVDWDEVEEGEIRIRQRPGPRNALGGVKFGFPNQHVIYLHDTSEPYLFDRRHRSLSHGCIRVRKPVDLAVLLLEEAGWSAERVRVAMDSDRPRRVEVPRPVPVYLLYLTAWTDRSGAVHFRDDLYGYDRALTASLAEVKPSPEEARAARRSCRELLERS